MNEQEIKSMFESHDFFDERLEHLAEEMLNEIVVPRQLQNLHPLVEQAREDMGAGSANHANASKRYRDLPKLHINVTKQLQKRALLIMDSVVKSAERLGFEFGRSNDTWRHGLYACGYGFCIKFKLREPEQRKLRPPTAEEKEDMKKYSWMRGPKYEKIRFGKLLLELDGPLGTSSYSVKDGKKVKVEDSINRLFMFLIVEIDRIRKIRAQRESEKQEAERQKRILVQQQAERERAKERERSLFDEAIQWHNCQILRQYIEAIRGDQQFDSTHNNEWVEWALSVAEKYDPVSPDCHQTGRNTATTEQPPSGPKS